MLIEAILACLAAGLVVGVAWRLITPEIVVEVTANGTRLPPLQAGKLFSVEAWFAILGAGAGVVLAIVLFMRHRHQPAAALAGAVAGGSLGALVAWRLGVLLGPGPLGSQLAAAAEGDLVPVPRDIDAYGSCSSGRSPRPSS